MCSTYYTSQLVIHVLLTLTIGVIWKLRATRPLGSDEKVKSDYNRKRKSIVMLIAIAVAYYLFIGSTKLYYWYRAFAGVHALQEPGWLSIMISLAVRASCLTNPVILFVFNDYYKTEIKKIAARLGVYRVAQAAKGEMCSTSKSNTANFTETRV